MLVSLDIQKERQGEYWTNRYILEVDSVGAANGPANEIVALERAIHLDVINFTSYRVSDMDPGTDAYIVVPIGLTGQRTVATQALPLFDVARVDFPAALGRPSRKYLRGVLAEGDQTNFGQLENATITFLDEEYAEPMGDVEEFVDVDGQQLGAGRVIPSVAMRQLRRGSRRRTEPVIPVS